MTPPDADTPRSTAAAERSGDLAAAPSGRSGERDGGTPPPSPELDADGASPATRAAKDVSLLVESAHGLRRAVELAEQIRRQE